MSEYKKTITLIKNRLIKIENLEEQIKPIGAKITKLNSEVKELEKKLIGQMDDEGIDKVSIGGFDIRKNSREIVTIVNFEELCQYAAKTKNWGLFVKRLNSTGFKEQFQDEDGSWKKSFPKWADTFIQKSISFKRSK